jgi:hypothetical protein
MYEPAGLESHESVAEALVVDPEEATEGGTGHGLGAVSQGTLDGLWQRKVFVVLIVGN